MPDVNEPSHCRVARWHQLEEGHAIGRKATCQPLDQRCIGVCERERGDAAALSMPSPRPHPLFAAGRAGLRIEQHDEVPSAQRGEPLDMGLEPGRVGVMLQRVRVRMKEGQARRVDECAQLGRSPTDRLAERFLDAGAAQRQDEGRREV